MSGENWRCLACGIMNNPLSTTCCICGNVDDFLALQNENATLRQQLAEAREKNSTIAMVFNRLLEETKWQPIETAPKDGTWLVVFTALGSCFIARWNQRHEEWAVPGSGLANVIYWKPLGPFPGGEADHAG